MTSDRSFGDRSDRLILAHPHNCASVSPDVCRRQFALSRAPTLTFRRLLKLASTTWHEFNALQQLLVQGRRDKPMRTS